MKPITADAVRPSISAVSDITFSKIPFGPVIRRLRPGTVKILAAVTRSSWVEQDTRRRVSLASNRQLAELAAVADPETIGRHVRELAEAGVITIEDHEGRRLLTFPESQPGEFVVLDNADQAWTLNPVPFVVLLAVRSFDWTNRGQSWPTDATLARSLGWTVRSVKRAMSALRRAGAVVTSSRYDPVRRSRKRVVTIAGKVVLLCDADHSRKSGPHLSGKVVPTQPEKWSSPTRKSGPLNQRFEIENELKPEPPTKAKFSGQSESAALAEEVVVGESVPPPPDTDPKTALIDEVVGRFAGTIESSALNAIERTDFRRALRKMIADHGPIAGQWIESALAVKRTKTTISLGRVAIANLRRWTELSGEERAAVPDRTTAEEYGIPCDDATARRKARLEALRTQQSDPAKVVRSKFDGQERVQRPDGSWANKALPAENGSGTPAHVVLAGRGLRPAPAETPTAEPAPPPPPPIDPTELERRERERAERERAEAVERERSRIEFQQSQIEREQSEETNRRLAAWTSRRTNELIGTMRSDPVGLRQRLAAERAIEAERIESEVRAEFAPKFAALKPPPLAVAFASATA